jgi:hypothetical protein
MAEWLRGIGVRQVRACIHPDHKASQKVAVKIGLHRTRQDREWRRGMVGAMNASILGPGVYSIEQTSLHTGERCYTGVFITLLTRQRGVKFVSCRITICSCLPVT